MKKWLLLILAMIMLGAQLAAAVTNVAILPLKRLDRSSEYIRKLLTVRDLALTFEKNDKYNLKDMKETEKLFKESGFTDVDDLQVEEMTQIAKMMNTDILIMGNISAKNQQSFTVSMRMYSSRSNELKQVNFDVGKEKTGRWKVLDEKFMVELNAFVSIEMDKIFNIAINYYSAENYTEAVNNLKLVLALNPDNMEAQYYLGSTYLKQQKYNDAITALNIVLAKDANNIQALRSLADVYDATKDNANKMMVLEKIAAVDADEEMWFSLGNLYAEANNVPKAISSLQNAIKLNPEFDKAYYRLAFLLYDEQRFGDALEYLEYAYNKYPDNDIIAKRLAISYQRSGRINEAITKYESVIQNNPTNAQAYLNVVGLYRTMASDATDPKIAADYYQKAINSMEALKKNSPDNGLVYLNLSSIYLAQKKYNEAESNANLATTKDGTMYQPFIILAAIQQIRGSDKYNQFSDLEKKASKAVGRQATSLGKERDAARASANAMFRKADELLRSAKSRTNDNEVINDINKKLADVASLISKSASY